MIIDRIREEWSRQGSSLSPGKPPLRLLQDSHGKDRTWPASQSVARWLDHCYMGIDRASGERVWVSEPYGVSPDAESDFAMLRGNGFSVEIDPPCLAKRHSDRVTVVLIRRG